MVSAMTTIAGLVTRAVSHIQQYWVVNTNPDRYHPR